MPLKSDHSVEAFWSTVDKSDDASACWEWKGGFYTAGYGRSWNPVADRITGAHRAALELTLGRELHPRMWALHSCDNRKCCNPAHLSEGTPSQNQQEALERGGRIHGEKHVLAKITDPQIRVMRALREQGQLLQAIADKFGVARSYVCRVIRGTRRRRTT